MFEEKPDAKTTEALKALEAKDAYKAGLNIQQKDREPFVSKI